MMLVWKRTQSNPFEAIQKPPTGPANAVFAANGCIAGDETNPLTRRDGKDGAEQTIWPHRPIRTPLHVTHR
jgi:hypothetical protein